VILLIVTRGQLGRGRVLWVVAMSVFAVSVLHLSNNEGSEDPWWLQLAGHHASLPLALLILYQDFRFALADIFLKRALALKSAWGGPQPHGKTVAERIFTLPVGPEFTFASEISVAPLADGIEVAIEGARKLPS